MAKRIHCSDPFEEVVHAAVPSGCIVNSNRHGSRLLVCLPAIDHVDNKEIEPPIGFHPRSNFSPCFSPFIDKENFSLSIDKAAMAIEGFASALATGKSYSDGLHDLTQQQTKTRSKQPGYRSAPSFSLARRTTGFRSDDVRLFPASTMSARGRSGDRLRNLDGHGLMRPSDLPS